MPRYHSILHGDISDLEAKKNYLNPLIHFIKSYYREKYIIMKI